MVPFLFAFLFLLSSCAVKYNDGVERYALKECYKLDKKEKLVAIDSIVSEKYSVIFELGKHQMPLNRAFQNVDYETYIGLALSSNSENLYEDHLKNPEITILENKKDKKRYHLLFQKDQVYVYRMIYNEPIKKITVVMNFVGNDKNTIQKLYEQNEEFLSKKINCGKD